MADGKRVTFYLTDEDLEKLDRVRSQNCERRTRSNMIAILIERAYFGIENKEAIPQNG